MRLLFTDRALTQIEDIGLWLRERSSESVTSFAEALEKGLTQLQQDLEDAFSTGSLLPRVEETASLAF